MKNLLSRASRYWEALHHKTFQAWALRKLAVALITIAGIAPLYVAYTVSETILMDVQAFLYLVFPTMGIVVVALWLYSIAIHRHAKLLYVPILLFGVFSLSARAVPIVELPTAIIWEISNERDTVYTILNKNIHLRTEEVHLIRNVEGTAEFLTSEEDGIEFYKKSNTVIEFILMQQTDALGRVTSKTAILRLHDKNGDIQSSQFYPADCHFTSY